MPAKPPVVLDATDQRLLELLQEDASRTLHELGDLVALSASAVQRRINRYRAAGLLSKQVAVLAHDAVTGLLLAVVLVTVDRESREYHAAFRERMVADTRVQQCYAVAGEWDYVVVLATTGMTHCRDVVRELFLGDPNIKRFDTLAVFDPVKVGLALPVG